MPLPFFIIKQRNQLNKEIMKVEFKHDHALAKDDTRWYLLEQMEDLHKYKPVQNEDLLTKCGWSSFAGWELTGWAVTTIVGGQVVYANHKVNSDVRGQALQFG